MLVDRTLKKHRVATMVLEQMKIKYKAEIEAKLELNMTQQRKESIFYTPQTSIIALSKMKS